MAFYTDKNGHGTFACKVRGRGNGRIFCDIVSLCCLFVQFLFILSLEIYNVAYLPVFVNI